MAIYIGRDEGEAPGWRGVKIDEDGGEEYSEPFRTKAEALDWESDCAYSEWLASKADENYRQEMIDGGTRLERPAMSIGKRKAKQLADVGGISIGQLREMIQQSRGRGGPCNINPALTHEQACDIFERALEGRDANEIPKTLVEDIYRPGRMRVTRDHITISNILRVCGEM